MDETPRGVCVKPHKPTHMNLSMMTTEEIYNAIDDVKTSKEEREALCEELRIRFEYVRPTYHV